VSTFWLLACAPGAVIRLITLLLDADIELARGIIAALIEHLVPLPDCKGATP